MGYRVYYENRLKICDNMKGFDLCLNDKNIRAGVETGVVVINIDLYDRISISGIDNRNFESVNWFQSKLNLKDKIKITVSEINESSPFNASMIDRQELLKEYEELKRNLENEGLL